MSIQIPIKLKILQNGAAIGYVETLNFVSGATIAKNGPIAEITVSGGGGSGGGDADTLQGHHASHFALQSDFLALEVDVNAIIAVLQRSIIWRQLLGVAVQATPPATGATYAQWLAGASNPFAWIQTP
jgi:hypothetical protein